MNCGGTHTADDVKTCPKAIQRKEADRKRSEPNSQGPRDWFAVLGNQNTTENAPVLTVQSQNVNEQPGGSPNTENDCFSQTDSGVINRSAPLHSKRRCISVSSFEEIPQLELHVEEGVRVAIRDGINDEIISSAIADVLGASSEPNDRSSDAEEKLRSALSDIVSRRVQTFLSSLRL